MNVKLLTEHNLNVKRRLNRLVWVYTCQNATLLEIRCHGSNGSTKHQIQHEYDSFTKLFWCNFCRHSGSTFPRYSRWANDAEICNSFCVCKWCKDTVSSDVEIIKLFSCSIQTSMKFILLKHSLGQSLILFFHLIVPFLGQKMKILAKNIDDWTQATQSCFWHWNIHKQGKNYLRV